MTDAERLERGAARIRTRWCRNALEDGRGGVCAMGSLADDTSSERKMTESIQKDLGALIQCAEWIARAINAKYGDPHEAWYQVVDWNNADHQTAENVAQGLELAAVLSRESLNTANQEVAELVRA